VPGLLDSRQDRTVFKSTDAETPDEYIDRLDEPRRTEVQRCMT